jgi:hypothetical protein
MKNIKKTQNLLEQINIQKKIIEELNYKNILLEKELQILKNTIQNKDKCVEICDKCGKMFLFTSSKDCCN